MAHEKWQFAGRTLSKCLNSRYTYSVLAFGGATFWGVNEVNALSKLKASRPSYYDYAQLSKCAYLDDGGTKNDWPDDWERVKVKNDLDSGYYGVAYENKKTKRVVIAHRGSDNAKNLLSDAKLVYDAISTHQIRAIEFSYDVKNEFNQHSLSFTGHSLGGWIAQLCVYHLKSTGTDSHAVVFDSPGASSMLKKLQPYDSTDKVSLPDLDITLFFSDPNLVNTCGSLDNVGTLYWLNSERQAPNRFLKYFPMLMQHLEKTSRTHPMNELLNAFDKKTGEPKSLMRVKKWPTIEWQNSGNQSVFPLPKFTNPLVKSIAKKISDCLPEGATDLAHVLTDVFQGNMDTTQLDLEEKYKNSDDYDGIYRRKNEANFDVIEADNKRLALRHFDSSIRKFLLAYAKCKPADQKEFLKRSTKNPDKIFKLLSYRILNGKVLLVDDQSKINAVIFRDQVTQAVKDNAGLSTLSPTRYVTIFESINNSPNWTDSEIDSLKNEVDKQWKLNSQNLKEMVSTYTQSRLYLYGAATQNECNRHKLAEKFYSEQLTYNQLSLIRIGELIGELKDSDTRKTELNVLSSRLCFLKTQLQLLDKMNTALYHHKTQNFVLAKKSLAECFIFEKKYQDELGRLNIHDDLNLEILKARLHTLEGKLERISEPESKWKETVFVSYEKARETIPDSMSVLSSTGALLNDLGEHELANDYHEKAMTRISDDMSDVPKAVTMSNYAWGLFNQAKDEGINSEEGKKKINKALDLYEESLNEASFLATTWLYRGILYKAIGKNGDALSDYTAGIKVQETKPHPRILYHRSKLYQENGDLKNAKKDAHAARKALNIRSSKSPDYQNLLEDVNYLIAELDNTSSCSIQ